MPTNTRLNGLCNFSQDSSSDETEEKAQLPTIASEKKSIDRLEYCHYDAVSSFSLHFFRGTVSSFSFIFLLLHSFSLTAFHYGSNNSFQVLMMSLREGIQFLIEISRSNALFFYYFFLRFFNSKWCSKTALVHSRYST